MTRHLPTTGIRIDLRTIRSTGALVVLALACVGMAAGESHAVCFDHAGDVGLCKHLSCMWCLCGDTTP